MPKRGERDDAQFSLEEIIAEVKSERPAQQPVGAAAPGKDIDIDLTVPSDALDAWLTGRSKTPPVRRRPTVGSHEPPAPEQTSLFGDLPPADPADRPASPKRPVEQPPATERPAPARETGMRAERPTDRQPAEPVTARLRQPAYAGRHTVPAPPSEAETLLEQLPLEEEAPAPAEEPAQPAAPWRTRPDRPAPPDALSEPEPEEEPGPKAPPRPPLPYDLLNRPYDDAAEAAEAMGKALSSLSSRLLLMIPLLLTSIYMTVCGVLSLPMPFGFTYPAYPFYYQLVFCVLQGLTLLVASPSTASGLWRLLKGRPTLDTLVLFTGLCSLLHSGSVILRPQWGGYLPYTCVSALTCFFALVQKRQRATALRRSYKAVLMGTVPTGLKLHMDGNRIAIAVKTAEGGHVELSDLAQADTTERFSRWYAPLAMVCALGFAAVCSFGRGEGTRFLWALAAISSAAAPVGLLLSASGPAKRLSKKLFSSGSMLVGGAAARQLARARALVLEDNDLFPAGSVTLAGMKVADNQSPEIVIACAAAMLQEVGGGLARAFAELQRQQYIAPLRAEELRFFESGGLSAKVGGVYALLGSANFLLRMGVRVTEGLQLKNSLFLSMDGRFAGIFSMRYSVQPPVYAAFGLLRRAHVQPVLALRDLNTTQAFVESRFDLKVDSTEYPVLSDRLRLSAPSYARELPTLALLSRDGLLPAAETLAAARQLTRAARLGRALGLVSACAGMLLLYFLCWRGAFAAAAPYNVLLYTLLWALPCALFSRVTTRL